MTTKSREHPHSTNGKNTASVIEWFKAIKNKQHHSFTCKTFDPYAQTATPAKDGR